MAKCKNCVRLYRAYDEKNEVVIGKWCDKIFDCPDVEMERDCIFYKPKTNADRIRAMDDEELARFLHRIDHYSHDGKMIVVLDGAELHDGQMEILEWLKREE